jgi:uncharacterized protein involved in exopolysaccharide biosynthesis
MNGGTDGPLPFTFGARGTTMQDTPANLPLNSSASDVSDDLTRFVRLARQEWRLFATCCGVCLGLGVVYLLLAKSQYQAVTRLLLMQQRGLPLSVANSDPSRPLEESDDYIPNQIAIVSSHAVMRRAIDSVGIESLPTLFAAQQGGADPLEVAINRLKITRPESQAKAIQIDYRAGSPGEAVRLIEAVVDSYRHYMEENYQRNGDVVALITRVRNDLAGELEAAEKEYLDFCQKHPTLIKDEKGRSLLTNRLERLDRAASEARVRELQIRAQLELGRNLAKEGTGLWAILHAMNQLDSESGTKGLADHTANAQSPAGDYIRQLDQEMQQLAERFGPQYTKVKDLRDQITRIQERTRASRGVYEQGEVSDLLKSLEQTQRASEAMRAEMAKCFEQEVEAEGAAVAEVNFRTTVERRRALFNTALDQLKQAQLVSGFGSVNLQVLQPATPLPQAVYPRKLQTLALALLIGCVSGTGIAAVRRYRAARRGGRGVGAGSPREPGRRRDEAVPAVAPRQEMSGTNGRASPARAPAAEHSEPPAREDAPAANGVVHGSTDETRPSTNGSADTRSVSQSAGTLPPPPDESVVVSMLFRPCGHRVKRSVGCGSRWLLTIRGLELTNPAEVMTSSPLVGETADTTVWAYPQAPLRLPPPTFRFATDGRDACQPEESNGATPLSAHDGSHAPQSFS